ncbi:MAG: protein translocase subunit SecF [Nitrospinota bacterium]
MEFFKAGTRIDFVGKRRQCLLLSGGAILLSLLYLLLGPGLNYGIDFRGGTLVQVRFERPVPIETIREVLGALRLGDTSVQYFGDEREVLIRVEKVTGALEGAEVPIQNALTKELGGGRAFEVRRTEAVGPQVGAELRRKAYLSLIYALGGILLYIAWRFELRFAVGAVLALIHDVTITLGVISLTGKEFTLPIVAAVLAIIGYSLNDTIVVFDRIRENLRGMRRVTMEQIINTSINQTLSRTILTAGTTLLAVGAFFVLGSEIIRDFAFALLIGIVVGTYSSIYIASPILLAWPTLRPAPPRRPGRG